MCVLSGMSFFAVNISAINRDFYGLKNVLSHPEMYVSTVNLRLRSKLLSFAKTAEISEGLRI